MKHLNYSFTLTCAIILSLASSGLSEDTDRNCQLFYENGEELSRFDWSYGVSLPEIKDITNAGTKIVKYKGKNIEQMNSLSSPAEKYLNADYDYETSEFYIEVNEYFASYEEYETKAEFNIKIEFYCTSSLTRSIVFTQKIIDTNNHAPEFLNAPYKFNLPMPIPKGFDFEQLGKIVARDVDLTNNHVLFTIKKDDGNSNGFSITSNGRDKKNFPAKLFTSDTLDLENDVTLVVYATDSGKPSLTSNTTITITMDKENSAPRFSHVLYTADLTKVSLDEVKEVEVTFSQGIITLERGYEGVKAFEISRVSDENKKHLKLAHSGILRKNNIELQLKLVNLTKEFLSQGMLSLVITAVKDKVKAETALQILFPEVKNNINSTTENPKCEEKVEPESNSINGYMIATIILSLITLGLIGCVVYSFINRKE